MELEINELGRPSYKSPTVWLSAITVVVAFVGVLGQNYLSRLDRAQAQLDRDFAILTKEKTQREVAELEAERVAKQQQIIALTTEIESLKLESLNRKDRLRDVVAAVASVPFTTQSSELNAAVQAASKSLYSTIIYAHGVARASYNAVVAATRKAGYTVLKAELLAERTSWLAEKSSVLYDDEALKPEAEQLSELIERSSGVRTIAAKDSSLGVPQCKESPGFRVHLVR